MHTVKSIELFETETKTTPAGFVRELRVQPDILVVIVDRPRAEHVQNSQFVPARHTRM